MVQSGMGSRSEVLPLTGVQISRKKFLNRKPNGAAHHLIDASYSNSMCKRLHPRISALHDHLGVEMPLSPLVSADVPTVSIAAQHLLSGPAQTFPPGAARTTNHRANPRRYILSSTPLLSLNRDYGCSTNWVPKVRLPMCNLDSGCAVRSTCLCSSLA